MTSLWIVLAILAPWLAGAAILRSLQILPEAKLFSIGAGWLVGQAVVMLLTGAMFALGVHSHARLILMALLAGAGALILRSSRSRQEGAIRSQARNSVWGKFIVAVILISLCLKLLLLVANIRFVPVRGDDAISIWLFKAKVIAGLDRIPRDSSGPYYLGGSNQRYPLFVPLMAAWTPLVVGHWDERVSTIPWLLCGVNLGLMFAGGLRRWLGPTGAWLAAYAVVSLPLLAVHIERPGYADLIVASFLTGSVLCLLLWQADGSAAALALGIALAAVTACLKREGPILAAITMIAMLLPAWRSLRSLSRRAGLGVLIVVAASAAMLGIVVDRHDLTASAADLAYQSGVGRSLLRHAFEWASFGPAFWLVTIAICALCVVRPKSQRRTHRASALLLSLGLIAYVALVFLSPLQARFALNDQTPSRLLLQAAPATMMILAVGLAELLTRSGPQEPTSSMAGSQTGMATNHV